MRTSPRGEYFFFLGTVFSILSSVGPLVSDFKAEKHLQSCLLYVCIQCPQMSHLNQVTRHVLHPPSPQHAHGGWHCQCSTVIKGNPAFFSVCTVFCGYNDDSRWVLSRTTHKCIWLYVTEVSDMWPHGCVWVTERGVNILVVQPHVMTFSRVCTPLVLYNPKVVTQSLQTQVWRKWRWRQNIRLYCQKCTGAQVMHQY